jgi:hypothetical protein
MKSLLLLLAAGPSMRRAVSFGSRCMLCICFAFIAFQVNPTHRLHTAAEDHWSMHTPCVISWEMAGVRRRCSVLGGNATVPGILLL